MKSMKKNWSQKREQTPLCYINLCWGATLWKFIPKIAKEMINSISIPMGLLGILREAIKIFKTKKLIHSIACLVLIPSSLLFLTQELAFKNKFPDLVTDAYPCWRT